MKHYGDKNELYMDVYPKQYNECFNVVVTDDEENTNDD